MFKVVRLEREMYHIEEGTERLMEPIFEDVEFYCTKSLAPFDDIFVQFAEEKLSKFEGNTLDHAKALSFYVDNGILKEEGYKGETAEELFNKGYKEMIEQHLVDNIIEVKANIVRNWVEILFITLSVHERENILEKVEDLNSHFNDAVYLNNFEKENTAVDLITWARKYIWNLKEETFGKN